MNFGFNPNRDYHEQFNTYVEMVELIVDQEKRPNVKERIKIVSDLLDDYVDQIGERPPTEPLNDLARIIDIDYYKSKNARLDKGLEYNYHTESQAKRRAMNEAGEHTAEFYDTEGDNTTLPTRSNRRKERELVGDDSLSKSVPPPFSPTRAYGKTITYTL